MSKLQFIYYKLICLLRYVSVTCLDGLKFKTSNWGSKGKDDNKGPQLDSNWRCCNLMGCLLNPDATSGPFLAFLLSHCYCFTRSLQIRKVKTCYEKSTHLLTASNSSLSYLISLIYVSKW